MLQNNNEEQYVPCLEKYMKYNILQDLQDLKNDNTYILIYGFLLDVKRQVEFSTFVLIKVVLVFAITRLEIPEMFFVTIQPASMLTVKLSPV